MTPEPVYEFYRNGGRHERNQQCPAVLKTRPGHRCVNSGRYLLNPADPDSLWLVCGVHRRDAARRIGEAMG